VDNEDPIVRKLSIERLGQLGDKRAIEPLLGMLKSEYKEAEIALAKLGASKEQMFNGFITVLSLESASARKNAVVKLGDFRDKRAIEPLRGILTSKFPNIGMGAHI